MQDPIDPISFSCGLVRWAGRGKAGGRSRVQLSIDLIITAHFNTAPTHTELSFQKTFPMSWLVCLFMCAYRLALARLHASAAKLDSKIEMEEEKLMLSGWLY